MRELSNRERLKYETWECDVQVVGAVGWDNARLPVPDTLPAEIAGLIQQTWADPGERPGFGDIIDRLKPLLLLPSLYPPAPEKEGIAAAS